MPFGTHRRHDIFVSTLTLYTLLLLSGKICLFILENTNFTNNTNPCGTLPLLIAYELHEYHPDGKNSCYSPLIKKCSFRMEIRVIREIRVLLNIEIHVFFRLNIYEWACMSTTIHQTKSYLYLPDSNKIDYYFTNTFLSFTK